MENKIRPLLRRKETAIMGIINTTPDSFSDGGRFVQKDDALRQAIKLIDEGADILDIGGESTRPGAEKVSLQQELDRVLPVIECIVNETATPVSIDTYKPDVMRDAVAAGASMVNDVKGLREEGAVELVAQLSVPVCIMHMLSPPKTMQQAPEYEDVVSDVIAFLSTQIKRCQQCSIDLNDIVIDPGIGFGKTLEHNLSLLKAVSFMRETLGCDVLIGVSRKSMINNILGRQVNERVAASVGLAVQAALNGAKILRVHDVRQTYDAIRSVEAVLHSEQL